MKLHKYVPVLGDPTNRPCIFGLFIITLLVCGVSFFGTQVLKDPLRSLQLSQGINVVKNTEEYTESVGCEATRTVAIEVSNTTENVHNETCNEKCRPVGSEALPKGIVSTASNLELYRLTGPIPKKKSFKNTNLLAVAAGIKQKIPVDQIVKKFLGHNFAVMLFHYDGVVDEWHDLEWNDIVIHISAKSQTKWESFCKARSRGISVWFAKRFLHPDIVDAYDHIFLWDEDLDVQNFHPERYLSIIKEEGLEISQPGLGRKSSVNHAITSRKRRSRVHRRYIRPPKCEANSTGPPCVGWVEMMAPVFSRAAWRCAWYMIQNDLIHAWGLDKKLGYCAQGDRTLKVGIVDEEYIVHMGIRTLGENSNKNKMSPELSGQSSSSGSRILNERLEVRFRCAREMTEFENRWKNSVEEDRCWVDPFEPALK